MLLTEKLLEKMANGVVQRHVSEKIALNDGVYDTAQKEDMNQEQIKRLVEAVNNAMFQHKFNAPDTDQKEKYVTFDPANSDSVIHRFLDSAKGMMHEPEQSGAAENPMDFHSDLPLSRESQPEEECPFASAHHDAENGKPGIRGTVMIMRFRKAAELLRDGIYDKRHELQDSVEKLATMFTRLGHRSFEEFEKDAFFSHGDKAVPFLNILRHALDKPDAVYNHTEFSKVARFVNNKVDDLQLFNETVKVYEELCEYRKAAELNENLLREKECSVRP